MSPENSKLREDALSQAPRQIWQSVNQLQSKYGNADTKIQLLEQGAMVSKPRIQQTIKAKVEIVRSDNLSKTAFDQSKQFRKLAKAEEAARQSANQALQSMAVLDEMKKVASPEKTFANHPVWTASQWNAFEERCDVCRGSGKVCCSACGGHPRKECMQCRGRGAETCLACGGFGLSGGHTCTMCGGTGNKPCGYCGGKGNTGYCRACRNGKVTCNKCNGRQMLFKGVAGRVSISSQSNVLQDESSPLKSSNHSKAKWVCSQADSCEQTSSKVIDGQLVVEWRLSVSMPYIRYSVDGDNFTSEVEGKSVSSLWHGPFLDQAFSPVLKRATEQHRNGADSEEKLRRVCNELRSEKLGTAILKLSAGRHRNPSELRSELKGSASDSLLSQGFAFANKVVSDIADRSGRAWLHRGCLIIGFASILVFAIDKWFTPSRWLRSWFGFDLHPLGTMLLVPFVLTCLLAGVIGLRTTIAAKRLTGFHIHPRRLSKRTILHLLFSVFGSLIATILSMIVISVFFR